jgi:hypothetical protein
MQFQLKFKSGKLLKSIQTSDPQLLAGMTTIRADSDPVTGLYTDFERAADFLLRIAPKPKFGQRDINISGVQQDYDSYDKQTSKGPKTGVELRYHTRKEFMALTKEEKDELLALRKNDSKDSQPQGKGKNSNKNANKRNRKYVKKLEARIAALETEKNEDHRDKRKALERPTQRND